MSFIKYACKCGQLCHKNNLCGHGINAGVCCTCYECLAELEDSDYGEEEEEEEHPAHKFFEERDCAYCRVFFEQGKDNCKECGFDLNSWNKEEEEDLPTCCGKNCDETKGLKLGMGWNLYHFTTADMITEQLWCENCANEYMGHACKGCREYHPYTEMTYQEGGAFGDACYCYDQFFCKLCVDTIKSIDYDPDEYK